MGGMMRSLTAEFTMPPNAAPMMTPMARSSTLPRMANSLNSRNIQPSLFLRLRILRINELLAFFLVVGETTTSQRLITSLHEYVRGTRGSSTLVSKSDDELVLRDLV